MEEATTIMIRRGMYPLFGKIPENELQARVEEQEQRPPARLKEMHLTQRHTRRRY